MKKQKGLGNQAFFHSAIYLANRFMPSGQFASVFGAASCLIQPGSRVGAVKKQTKQDDVEFVVCISFGEIDDL